MAESQPIRYQEIFEDNVLGPFLAQMDAAIEKTKILEAQLKALGGTASAGGRVNTKTPVSEIQKLAEEERKLAEVEQGLETVLRQRIAIEEKRKAVIKSVRDSIKEQTAQEKIQKGSLNAMRAELAKLTKEYANTANPSKEFTAKVKDMTDKVKRAEEAIGDHRRSVGHYEKGLKSAGGVLRWLSSAFGVNTEAAEKAVDAAEALARSQKVAAVATKILNGTMSALGGPVSLIVTAVIALGTGIATYVSLSGDAAEQTNVWAEETKQLNKIKERENEILLEQNNRIQDNIDKIRILRGEQSDFDVQRAKVSAEERRNEQELVRLRIEAERELQKRIFARFDITNAGQRAEHDARVAEQQSVLDGINAQIELLRKNAAEELKSITELEKAQREAEENKRTEAKKTTTAVKAENKEQKESHADLFEFLLRGTQKISDKEKELAEQARQDFIKRIEAERADLLAAQQKKREQALKEISQIQQITKVLEQAFDQRAALQKKYNEKQVSELDRQIEFQRQLAVNGQANTLGFLERERAKKVEEQMLNEKRQIRRHNRERIAEIFLEAIKAGLKEGGNGNFVSVSGKALAFALGAEGIAAGIVGGAFAEGVEDFKGKGTTKSDSNLIRFSNRESVVTADGTAENKGLVTAMNEGPEKVQKWFMDSSYMPTFSKEQSSTSNPLDNMVGAMIGELRELKETVKQKKELHINRNMINELVIGEKENGLRKDYVQKRSPIIKRGGRYNI